MVDDLTHEQRSYCMSRIRSKDTNPEIIVRKIVHAMGYRFRLHQKDLPGKPDLVFRRLKKVVFVNGCFWHKHSCRYGKVKPKTNEVYWRNKINANVKRDRENRKILQKIGLQILIVWECETKNIAKLKCKLKCYLALE